MGLQRRRDVEQAVGFLALAPIGGTDVARRILVTGGCGFVGVPVVRAMVDRGYDVLVYDDHSRGAAERLDDSLAKSVRLVRGDVRNRDLLVSALRDHGSQVLIHLAAVHFIPDCDANPERCLSVNISGTQAVLDAAGLSPNVSAIVYASTAAVYEPDSNPHLEDASRLAPTDVYGYSKLAGEQLVSAFNERTGTACSIARLFNVFGPSETNPHLIPTAIRQAQSGKSLRLGNLATRRDYVFTDDVARALVSLADATSSGERLVCNVGTGETHTGEEIVSDVGRLLGRHLTVLTDPGRIRSSDRPALCADVSRAERLLGWRPQVSFEDGLAAAIEEPVGPGASWR